MSSFYRFDEPTLISFSGGRTSGYMLWKVIDAYDGELPDHFKICFANTGKEMPATLDFVRDCQEKWGVDITWLEYDGRTRKPDDPTKYNYKYKTVTYATASRAGEPFALLIDDMGMLPNPMSRICSGQLKVRTIDRFLKDYGFDSPYLAMIGLRADEQRRAVKLLGKINEGSEKVLPLYRDKVTKEIVADFWQRNDFDLALPNVNGVTDWGNCDLCFLKGEGKKKSIIEQRPDLADWWIEQERKQNDQFKRNRLSYSDLVMIATDNPSFLGFEDESIPCFCGD